MVFNINTQIKSETANRLNWVLVTLLIHKICIKSQEVWFRSVSNRNGHAPRRAFQTICLLLLKISKCRETCICWRSFFGSKTVVAKFFDTFHVWVLHTLTGDCFVSHSMTTLFVLNYFEICRISAGLFSQRAKWLEWFLPFLGNDPSCCNRNIWCH